MKEGGGLVVRCWLPDGRKSAPPTSKVTAKPWRRIRTGCPIKYTVSPSLLPILLFHFVLWATPSASFGWHPASRSEPPSPSSSPSSPSRTRQIQVGIDRWAGRRRRKREGGGRTTDDRRPIVGSPLPSNIPFFRQLIASSRPVRNEGASPRISQVLRENFPKSGRG